MEGKGEIERAHTARSNRQHNDSTLPRCQYLIAPSWKGGALWPDHARMASYRPGCLVDASRRTKKPRPSAAQRAERLLGPAWGIESSKSRPSWLTGDGSALKRCSGGMAPSWATCAARRRAASVLQGTQRKCGALLSAGEVDKPDLGGAETACTCKIVLEQFGCATPARSSQGKCCTLSDRPFALWKQVEQPAVVSHLQPQFPNRKHQGSSKDRKRRNRLRMPWPNTDQRVRGREEHQGSSTGVSGL